MLEVGKVYEQYKLIEIHTQQKSSGGTRKVYEFICPRCELNSLKIRVHEWNNGKRRFCYSCTAKKLPYESIYNSLIVIRKDYPENTLSYEEYLEFTKIKNCFYCNSEIPWEPYRQLNNNYISGSYFLDRKDNSLGYSKNNCVVCCTKCNLSRMDNFTFDEFRIISKILNNQNNLALIEDFIDSLTQEGVSAAREAGERKRGRRAALPCLRPPRP